MTRKKRPQYIIDIINSVNERLRLEKVKDANNNLFMWLELFLLKKNMYRGYNFFIDKENPYDNKIHSVLSGTDDPNKFDYLQFY